MPITVIKGDGRIMADAMRNTAIAQGRGALLIDGKTDAETGALLEKIIAGKRFVPGTDAEKVGWKANPEIILINEAADRLKEFDKICPGFSKKFGPVKTVGLK